MHTELRWLASLLTSGKFSDVDSNSTGKTFVYEMKLLFKLMYI